MARALTDTFLTRDPPLSRTKKEGDNNIATTLVLKVAIKEMDTSLSARPQPMRVLL